MEKKKRKRCHNCKFAGNRFKIGKLTHHICEDEKQYNQKKYDNNEFHPFDALRIFSDTCDKHEFKAVANVL